MGAPAAAGVCVCVCGAGAFFDREEALVARLVAPLFLGCLFLAAVDLDFALVLALPPACVPGMLCMSCCAGAGAAVMRNMNAATTAQNFARGIDLKLFTVPSRMMRKQTAGSG